MSKAQSWLVVVLALAALIITLAGIAEENARIQYPGFPRGYVDPANVANGNLPIPGWQDR